MLFRNQRHKQMRSANEWNAAIQIKLVWLHGPQWARWRGGCVSVGCVTMVLGYRAVKQARAMRSWCVIDGMPVGFQLECFQVAFGTYAFSASGGNPLTSQTGCIRNRWWALSWIAWRAIWICGISEIFLMNPCQERFRIHLLSVSIHIEEPATCTRVTMPPIRALHTAEKVKNVSTVSHQRPVHHPIS